MRHRHALTDEHRKKLEPLLPPQLNGILWILRTGGPWHDLPQRYGPWARAYSRFHRCQRTGVWARIFTELRRQADATGQLD